MPAARVLIIGDSISIGYLPHVTKLLETAAAVEHNPGNASDSQNIRLHLQDWALERAPEHVHLNCGLHDIRRRRPDGTAQVSINDYESNLRDILARLRGLSGTTLTWATTTPVIAERHNPRRDFDRFQRDVDAYNAVAIQIVREFSVPVIDLHAVATRGGIDRLLSEDGVHFTDEGYRLLADPIAAGIQQALARR